MYHAEFNLDRMRWLIVSGWYMEMDEHFDAAYGSWSKVEGKRSILTKRQLAVLESWRCGRTADEIMETLVDMIPELLRLNRILSEKVKIETNEEQFKRVLELAY